MLACHGLGPAGCEVEPPAMAMLVSVAVRPEAASPGGFSVPDKPKIATGTYISGPYWAQASRASRCFAAAAAEQAACTLPPDSLQAGRHSRLARLPKSRQLLGLAVVACTLQRDENRQQRREEPDDSNVTSSNIGARAILMCIARFGTGWCAGGSSAASATCCWAATCGSWLKIQRPTHNWVCQRTSLHGNPKSSMPPASRPRHSAIQDLPLCNNARHMCGPPRHPEFYPPHLHLSCS